MIKQCGTALVSLLLPGTAASGQRADNQLSAAEMKDGWKSLFDGTSTGGWHTYNHAGE